MFAKNGSKGHGIKSGDLNKNKYIPEKQLKIKSQTGGMIPVEPKKSDSFKKEGHGLPKFSIRKHNWGFETENGKISKLILGNLTDSGWYWRSDMDGIGKPNNAEGDLTGFLVRISNSKIRDEFLESMKEKGITLEMLKPIIKRNIEKGESGLYQITGDNSRWHFGNDEYDAENRLFDDLENYNNVYGKMTQQQQEKVQEEFWNNFSSHDYDHFEKVENKRIKGILLKGLEESSDLDDLLKTWNDWDTTKYPIEEMYSEYQDKQAYDALNKTIIQVQKEKKLGE